MKLQLFAHSLNTSASTQLYQPMQDFLRDPLTDIAMSSVCLDVKAGLLTTPAACDVVTAQQMCCCVSDLFSFPLAWLLEPYGFILIR